MNKKKDKSLVEILTDEDYPAFEDTLKTRIIEKLAWAYYEEMQDDIKKAVNNINTTSENKP